MMTVGEYVKLSDSQLAVAARRDTAAFDELVRRYLSALYAFVCRLAGTPDAEDIVQETFVKAYTALGRYDTKKPLRTWLYAIAKHTAIDWLRRHRPTPFSAVDDEKDFAADIPDQAPLPDELFARTELAATLTEALAKLSATDRAILLMRYTEGFSLEEIAQSLQMPAGTVRSRHHRALVRLRVWLNATK